MKEQIVEQRILTADEGMYLTDGESYGKTVVLPANLDYSVWKEIPENEIPKEEDDPAFIAPPEE